MGNVPSLHDDLISMEWSNERQFAESLAVGQVAPGPNGLWVISQGYLMGGTGFALIALAAIILPPLFVLVLERVYSRIRRHPVVEGLVRGLSLAVVGVFAVVLVGLLTHSGLDARSIGIA